jgi:hypothetical protein
MKRTIIWIIVILAIFWAWKNHYIGPEFKNNQNPDQQNSGGVSRVVDNSAFDDIQPIRDFIHRGRSCGYLNGCNNGSPYQPQIDFQVDFLPAYIYAKLWKNKPEDKNSPSDFNVKLVLE